MKTLKLKHYAILGIASLALTITSCKKDSSNNGGTTEKSNTQISMTDAPIDNAEIKGVFVTVTEIKIDGETYSGFTGKKTFDIMAMQNGNTETIFNGDLENKTYNQIELVIDAQTDAQGNSPGSYILTSSNVKKEIKANNPDNKIRLMINNATTVASNSSNNYVVDFDLRKSVRQETNGDYRFASTTELNNAVRFVKRDQSGVVKGKVDQSTFNNYDKVVAYIYVKGTFNKAIEGQPQGSDKILFRNATSSSVVSSSDNFGFYFLNQGMYELHLVGYNDSDNDGSFELVTMFDLSSNNSINLSDINVTANANIEADIKVTGLLTL